MIGLLWLPLPWAGACVTAFFNVESHWYQTHDYVIPQVFAKK